MNEAIQIQVTYTKPCEPHYFSGQLFHALLVSDPFGVALNSL